MYTGGERDRLVSLIEAGLCLGLAAVSEGRSPAVVLTVRGPREVSIAREGSFPELVVPPRRGAPWRTTSSTASSRSPRSP